MSVSPPRPELTAARALQRRLERLQACESRVLESGELRPTAYPPIDGVENLRLAGVMPSCPEAGTETFLQGHWLRRPTPCLRLELGLDFELGGRRLGEVWQRLQSQGSSLFADDESVEPADGLVFLDTETTGLHVGMGTYVYLTGLGRLTGQGFVLEQFLLPSPAKESSYLSEIAEALQQASGLVSFHGRGFDLPQLRARFQAQRQVWPEQLPHCDLALLSRGLWKASFERHRLKDYERHVLGYQRRDDIEGAECPQAWVDFLTRGVCHDLRRVLAHNALDILSLAFLSAVFLQRREQPETAAECFGAGRLALSRGAVETARHHWLCAARRRAALPQHHRGPSLWRLAQELGRLGESAHARSLLHELLEVDGFAEAARHALEEL